MKTRRGGRIRTLEAAELEAAELANNKARAEMRALVEAINSEYKDSLRDLNTRMDEQDKATGAYTFTSSDIETIVACCQRLYFEKTKPKIRSDHALYRLKRDILTLREERLAEFNRVCHVRKRVFETNTESTMQEIERLKRRSFSAESCSFLTLTHNDQPSSSTKRIKWREHTDVFEIPSKEDDENEEQT